MALLAPKTERDDEDSDEEDSVEGASRSGDKPIGANMDILANLGTNRATNIFTLKFLLCGGK